MIENQIIYNTNLTENLLIINKITLLQNYEIIKCDNLIIIFILKLLINILIILLDFIKIIISLI